MPFAWLLAENVLKSTKQAETGAEAAVASRRPVLVDLGIALVVIALAGAPFGTLETASLQYVNPCVAEHRGGAGETQTTYDTALETPDESPQIPLWWELVLSVSYGLTRAGIEGLGCTEDISLIRQKVDETRIQNPTLAGELMAFREQCFYPARSRFLELLQNPFFQFQWEQMKEAGLVADVDLEWEGSRVYRSTTFNFENDDGDRIQLRQPIYDTLHAGRPIPGFALDLARDSDFDYLLKIGNNNRAAADTGYQAPLPRWGIPSCNEWWSGTSDDNGLRTRLLATYEEGTLEWMKNQVTNLFTSKTQEQLEDELLMTLVSKEFGIPSEGNFTGSNYALGSSGSWWSAITRGMSHDAANLGLIWEKLSTGPMLNAIKASLPIVKAFLMMAVIMFIPILLVASGYRLEVVFLITIGLVAINFLSVIWGVAWALENGLLKALWPDQTDAVIQGKHALGVLSDPDWSLKVAALTFLLPFLYLFLPIVFFAVVGWAGLRVFNGIAGALSALTLPASQAGRSVSDKAKSKL